MKKSLLLTATAASIVLAVFATTPAYAAGTSSTTSTNCSGSTTNVNLGNLNVNLNSCTGLTTNTTSNSGVNVNTTVANTTVNATADTTGVSTNATVANTGVSATVDNSGVNVNLNTSLSNTDSGTNTTTNVNVTSTNTTPTTPATNTPVTAPTDTTSTSAPTATTTPTTPMPLANIKLGSDYTAVYPAKDGYRDSVTFSIKAFNALNAGVRIQGIATLADKTGKIVKTWNVDGTTDTITWDGRIGKKIKAGMYTLTVKAWDSAGTVKTASTTVRVLASHLVTTTAKVTSKVGAHATSAKMPAAVLKAFKYGKVTIKIRTVAHVTGKAKLVFQNKNAKRALVLKNGTHTTKALTVPAGFGKVTVKHAWKSGSAKLVSFKAIWYYEKLVK